MTAPAPTPTDDLTPEERETAAALDTLRRLIEQADAAIRQQAEPPADEQAA